MIQELLNERHLPELFPDKEQSFEARREEIKALAVEYEYGAFPERPEKLQFETVRENPQFASGKAVLRRMKLTLEMNGGSFSFPFLAVIPKAEEKLPFFVHIAFSSDTPDWETPIEEIVDRGFGYLCFNYQEVTRDDGTEQYAELLGGKICGEGVYPLLTGLPDAPSRENTPGGDVLPGKISVWAWAASLLLDYAATLPELDMSRSAVVGHSRLGKTALYAGLMDERFAYVIPNDSGCGGACLYRGIAGEDLDRVASVFPHWMDLRYREFSGRIEDYPLDQHFLIAACAPRKVYISAASEDAFADYRSMYLAAAAASEAYEKLGLPGFVHPDRLPEVHDVFGEGSIGFHLKKGPHSLGREDWNRFMDFIGRG